MRNPKTLALYSLGLTVLVSGLLLAFGSPKAHALNENTSNIPPSIQSLFYNNQNCNEGGVDHDESQYVWSSIAGDNSSNTAVIDFGTDTVQIWVNTTATNCNGAVTNGVVTNTNLKKTRSTISGVSTNVGSVANYGPGSVDVDYTNSYPIGGGGTAGNGGNRWVTTGGNNPWTQTITISGLAAVAAVDYDIVVQSKERPVNEFGGGVFTCVENGNVHPANLDGTDSNGNQVCNTWDNPITIHVKVRHPPHGNIDQTNCDNIFGWAVDPAFPSTEVMIQLFVDGKYVYGGKTDQVRGDVNAAYPGSGSAKHGFKLDVSGFKDAYLHTFKVYALDAATGSTSTLLGTINNGFCAPPTCSTFNSTPAIPEVGTKFTGAAGFNYSPGGLGRALWYDMGLDINGARIANTSQQYSTNGLYNYDGGPLPGGITRTNQISSNNIVINNPGPYTSAWPLQWVLPNDNNLGVLMNVLRNNHNAGGPYDFSDQRGVTGFVYGTIKCPGTGTQTNNVGQSPYVKVYGNDVAAGSKFADASSTTCNPTLPAPPSAQDGVGLWAFSKKAVNGSTYYGGASSQFASLSRGNNVGFSSASQRNPNTLSNSSPPVGLSFGNMIDSTGPVTNSYGGWAPTWHCIPDYFSAHTVSGADYRNAPTFVNPFGLFVKTVPLKQQTAMFVDGDAYITNDIVYATNADGTWSTITDIPNFYLIVKGDIYISAGVQNLAGTYVAQPKNATQGGRIYTCTQTTTLWPKEQLYSKCGNPLTITGSLIAKQVWYQRIRGTVSKSIPDAPTVATANEPPSSLNIAEIFNFSQESYLAPTPAVLDGVLGATATGRNQQYDGITSLPPIL